MLLTKKILRYLKALYYEMRKEKRKDFNRDLPLADYIVDRWEKAKSLGFGEGSSIYDSSLVLGDVSVGRQTWVGPFTILDGSGGGLNIGDFCAVSSGVHIYTHDTVNSVIYGAEVDKAPVSIGNHVYIGPNVIISKGVSIGDYVVIGANSFVNNDIPSFRKAFGTPAKVIGKIEVKCAK